MASNRLKRQQVESIYRTKRIDPGFEPVKVEEIPEVINHLGAMDFVIRTALEPLTSDYVKKLHYLLTYGIYADRKQYFGSGTFRTKPPRLYKHTTEDPREIAWWDERGFPHSDENCTSSPAGLEEAVLQNLIWEKEV